MLREREREDVKWGRKIHREKERKKKKNTLNRLIASKHHYFLDILFIFICFSFSASHLDLFWFCLGRCMCDVKCGCASKAKPSKFFFLSSWHGICAQILITEMWKKSKTHAHTQCIQITSQSILYVHKTCRPNMIDLKIKIRAKWDLELENRCVLLLWKINQLIEIMNLSKYTFRYIYLFIWLVGWFVFVFFYYVVQNNVLCSCATLICAQPKRFCHVLNGFSQWCHCKCIKFW